MSDSQIQKTCLFINRRSPYGSTHATESLDMAYALSAFEHKVSLLFIDDGVQQLLAQQQTETIGLKNFSPNFKAWEDYDIQNVYVEESSLQLRNIQVADLIIDVNLVSAKQIAEMINHHAFIFND